MKSSLLMIALTILLLCGASAFAQDPGVVDTIDLELTVDTIGLTATLELWGFSDEDLYGATMGFTWAGSPTNHFQMDTAIASSAITTGFDLGRFFFEDNSKTVTNTNQRFLFGGASLFGVYPADGAGRRLWATYTFAITSWSGWGSDGILIDTLTFNAGSTYLCVTTGNQEFQPYFTGKIFFGDPSTGTGNPPEEPLPTSYALAQNYPNPFNPTTEISYDLPAKSKVRLSVYNILGQEVVTLVNGEQPAGPYTVEWNAGSQASGIYFYKLEAGNFSETRKMLLLK